MQCYMVYCNITVVNGHWNNECAWKINNECAWKINNECAWKIKVICYCTQFALDRGHYYYHYSITFIWYPITDRLSYFYFRLVNWRKAPIEYTVVRTLVPGDGEETIIGIDNHWWSGNRVLTCYGITERIVPPYFLIEAYFLC